MFGENVTAVTAENFDEVVLKADVPVLVDFWAPWCGPCKMLAPQVDALANQNAGRIRVVSMNIEENKEFVKELGLRSVPTFYVYRNGERINSGVGQGALAPIRHALLEAAAA